MHEKFFVSLEMKQLANFYGGIAQPPLDPSNCKYLDVTTPHTGQIIAQVPMSGKADVAAAVQAASQAFSQTWSTKTVKSRAQILLRFHSLVSETYVKELCDLIVEEHGKTKAEAMAEIAKGLETLEFAISAPQLLAGRQMDVSRGVNCRDDRLPLGVVASIVPFNFPFMVPFWTIGHCIVSGNCLILKPSEKVPLTMFRVAEIWKEAGLPDGVFNIVNGGVEGNY
jgi:acyl-CoA reductase-like NAD-dependent aldehyde dehydrogenase